MSFLNSVLSSISTGSAPSLPAPNTATAPPSPPKPAASAIPSTSALASTNPNGTLKRKAEVLRNEAAAKIPRQDITRTDVPHQQIHHQNTTSSDGKPLLPGGLSNATPAIPSPRAPPSNYTGTATKSASRLDTAKDIPHRPTTSVPTNKAGGSSTQSSKPTQTAAKSPATRVLPPAAVISQNAHSAAPPKKGSYKEIMARAQALKAQQSDIMQIKHKPVAKMSKKERQANDAEVAERAKQEARSAKSNKPPNTPARASPAIDKRVPETQEKKRKPLDLGYSGTMRGQPVAAAKPAASGKTAAVSRPTPGKSASRPRPGGGRYTYATYSDEEEDEEDDYDSESDMEAGGLDELEREEMESLRVAKEEDARALREEQEHDRLKRERRRKLEQLAAARKK